MWLQNDCFWISTILVLDTQVMVVTTHGGLPEEFYGAKLIGSRRWAFGSFFFSNNTKLIIVIHKLFSSLNSSHFDKKRKKKHSGFECLDLIERCPGSFPLPWYRNVPLSLALSPRIISAVARFKPDIIHASSPGIMVYSTTLLFYPSFVLKVLRFAVETS